MAGRYTYYPGGTKKDNKTGEITKRKSNIGAFPGLTTLKSKDTTKSTSGSDVDREKNISEVKTTTPAYVKPVATTEVKRTPGKSSWELAGFPSREAFQEKLKQNAAATSAKNKAETEKRLAEDPEFETFGKKLEKDTKRRKDEAAARKADPEGTQETARRLNELKSEFMASGKTDPESVAAYQKQFADIRDGKAPMDDLMLPQIPEFVPPPVAPAGPSEADIKQQLIDETVSQNIRGLEDAFRKTTGALEASEAGLEERFRGQRGDIREQDIMQREGTRKLQATRNLSNAGAVGQSDISQKVITMGALSQSAAQEENIRADIQNQLVEAKAALASGIAGAESQGRVFALTEQLKDMQDQAARDLAKVELNDQRDYDMFIRELDKKDADELRIIEDEMNRKNDGYKSELRIAEANNDFELSKRLKAIIQSNAIKLDEIRTSNDILLETEKERLKGETEEDQGYDTKVFSDGIDRAIDGILVDPATGQRDPMQVKVAISQFLLDNAGSIRDDNQLDELLILYGLTRSEMESFLGQATQGQTGTGLGALNWNQ